MPPKIVKSIRSSGPRKSQTPAPARKPAEKKQLLLKLKLPKQNLLAQTLPKQEMLAETLLNMFPPTAPPSEHAPDESPQEELPNVKARPAKDGQSKRREARQKTKTHQPDMVFGSEMDRLMSLSTAAVKGKGEEEVNNASSPLRAFTSSLPPPSRDESSSTIQGLSSPPHRCAPEVSREASDILRALQSSLEVQIDLPDLTSSEGSHGNKAYTATLLTELYIQCYENELWHLCDLIADTWIRALQKANKRSYRSGKEANRMWRENKPLQRRFADGKSGLRKEPQEYGLDVQDPRMDRDVSAIDPGHLHDLFTYTRPDCGARKLWADAIALGGQEMEYKITKQSEVWPEALFYDVACSALRMVRRMLTLKIEERYEGAWCKYHEHVKHRQPCYRKTAWIQQGTRGSKPQADNESESEDDAMEGVEQGRKHVRFDVDSDVDGADDIGDVDAGNGTDTESDSEEEG